MKADHTLTAHHSGRIHHRHGMTNYDKISVEFDAVLIGRRPDYIVNSIGRLRTASAIPTIVSLIIKQKEGAPCHP